jgi:MT0933-like antitoxin protein
MSEFMDEAKKLASEHSDVADKGFDEAAQMADEKTGGKFDSQIQAGEQQAESSLGVQDQDQGQQDQNQQDQGQGQ